MKDTGHFYRMPRGKRPKIYSGFLFNGESRLWTCEYSQCAMQSSQARHPAPAFPGKVMSLTQEVMVSGPCHQSPRPCLWRTVRNKMSVDRNWNARNTQSRYRESEIPSFQLQTPLSFSKQVEVLWFKCLILSGWPTFILLPLSPYFQFLGLALLHLLVPGL